jgi:hypothetical protein
VSHLAGRHLQERTCGSRSQRGAHHGRPRRPRRVRVDDVAADLMLGEHVDHGGHAADRRGIGTEVSRNEFMS